MSSTFRIDSRAGDENNGPGGRETEILKRASREIARRAGCASRDLPRALGLGSPVPLHPQRRYPLRTGTLQLADSRCVVVPGVGRQVIVLLARLGVGTLVVADCDHFDETNLNRQASLHGETLGESKARAAVWAVRPINPGVACPSPERIDAGVIDAIWPQRRRCRRPGQRARRLLLQDSAGPWASPWCTAPAGSRRGSCRPAGRCGVKLLYGDAADRADPDRPEPFWASRVTAASSNLPGDGSAQDSAQAGILFGTRWPYVDLEKGRLDTFRLVNRMERHDCSGGNTMGNLDFTLRAFPSTLRITGGREIHFRQGDSLSAQCRRRHRRRGAARNPIEERGLSMIAAEALKRAMPADSIPPGRELTWDVSTCSLRSPGVASKVHTLAKGGLTGGRFFRLGGVQEEGPDSPVRTGHLPVDAALEPVEPPLKGRASSRRWRGIRPVRSLRVIPKCSTCRVPRP